MSLPLAFKTTVESNPTLPYLSSDNVKVAQRRAVLGEDTRPFIGLAWSGNPNHTNVRRRSIELAGIVSPAKPRTRLGQSGTRGKSADRILRR
jgi:hypothetical protein